MDSIGTRMIVIGLDGLSWEVYRKLRGRGYLSAISALESKGVTGSVDMIPPLTPPMWTSIVSGVNPGKHGIYSFNYIDENGRVIRLHNALDVMYPRVHNIVSLMGYQSFIANLPLSWPVLPFRGGYITDWLSPRPYASPEYVNEVFQKELESLKNEYRDDDVCSHIVSDLAVARTILRTPRVFDDKKFVFIMFGLTDTVQHRDPNEIANPSRTCVKEGLELVNEVIKMFSDRFIDDNAFMIVSDHGVDVADYVVSIPRILYDNGLVKVKYASLSEQAAMKPPDEQETEPVPRNQGLLVKLANLALRNRLLAKVAIRVGRKLVETRPSLRKIAKNIERPVIDDEASPVVIPREWSYGIYIKESMVNNVSEVVQKIMNVIRQAEIESGHRFVYAIVEGRYKFFKGPYSYRAPHVVVAPRRGYSFATVNVYAPLIRKTRLGSHHPQNLHVVVPPSSEPSLLETARLISQPWDYAAIMLLSMKLPLPHDTDSRICNRAGIRCEYKNFTIKYKLSLKAFKSIISRAKAAGS